MGAMGGLDYGAYRHTYRIGRGVEAMSRTPQVLARAFLISCATFLLSALYVSYQAIAGSGLEGTEWLAIPLGAFYLGLPLFVVAFPVTLGVLAWRNSRGARQEGGN